MKRQQYQFEFEVYDTQEELSPADAQLLQQAKDATANAYAPYSRFHVGAAALLANGTIVTGTNQENASYPAGICAERALLATIGALYPGAPVVAMAISYQNLGSGGDDHPISPCGICRQTLMEYEGRTGQGIRIILGGREGKVYVIGQSAMLLPLSFTSSDL